ncbi:MAG: glycosyltransferase [bacterium]
MTKLIKKPKIAILSIRNEYDFGGVLATLKVAHAFCSQYFEPTIFYLSFDKQISANFKSLKFTSANRTASFCGMPAIEVGSRWAFWEPGHYKFTQEQWREALKDYDYFFVVSATPIAAHPLVLLDKKFVLWASTSYDHDRTERVKKLSGMRKIIDKLAHKYMNKIQRDVLRKVSYVWPLSQYSYNQFEIECETLKSKSMLCGYPIDCEKIKRVPDVVREKNIIAVGRFSDPRKNIDMLMRAFERIYEKEPKARLYVVGQQPGFGKLQEFAHLKSFGHVVFTGTLEPKDLRHMYRQASLMLITSYQEGFGIAGLEALANGVPIVSTNCGGVSDFVVHGETGYLVDINDDKNMAIKALRILTLPDTHQKLAEQARVFVEKNFAQNIIFERFKFGLVCAYPELEALFRSVDKTSIKHNFLKRVIQYESVGN